MSIKHDRFELIRTLGRGGMGTVYEALDHESNIHVALKTISRLSPEALLSFKREFRSLVRISHPNLITLYEMFSSDEQWFFTMEGKIAGERWSQKLTGHRRAVSPRLAGRRTLREVRECRFIPEMTGTQAQPLPICFRPERRRMPASDLLHEINSLSTSSV